MRRNTMNERRFLVKEILYIKCILYNKLKIEAVKFFSFNNEALVWIIVNGVESIPRARVLPFC